MARKDEQGLMQATAEDLDVTTPDEVPEWVDCFVSKRQIPGEQARYVAFKPGKNVWIHKRFLGEFDVAVDDDEQVANEFEAEYEDLELGEAGFAGEGAIEAAVEKVEEIEEAEEVEAAPETEDEKSE